MSLEVTPGIIFREAKEDDCDKILELLNALLLSQGLTPDRYPIKNTTEDLRRDGFGDNKAFNCALVEDIQGRTVCLQDLFVDEEYRRKGIGRNLMRHVAKVAVEQNCKAMFWFVIGSSDDSQRFYKRCGAINLTAEVDFQGFKLKYKELKNLAAEDLSANIQQCVD